MQEMQCVGADLPHNTTGTTKFVPDVISKIENIFYYWNNNLNIRYNTKKKIRMLQMVARILIETCEFNWRIKMKQLFNWLWHLKCEFFMVFGTINLITG